MYYEDGISVLGIDIHVSQKEPYKENIKDEAGFQIHIQSRQSWQLVTVTCWQGRCPARAEHCESVFRSSFLRFTDVAASICLHNVHRLMCDLDQDNHDHPSTSCIPKD